MTTLMHEMCLVLDEIAAGEGGPMWFDRPDRWWDDPHWRCINGHVSTCYLKSEERGAVRLAGRCRMPVALTFPEDSDGCALRCP